ncbi:MAG: c-type cytochrome [Tepidisphaerales bacterium]
MPVGSQTFRNTRTLNRVFAVSALVLAAVVLWSIFHDHDRPWRKIQRDAAVWDAALTAEQLQDHAASEVTKRRLESLDPSRIPDASRRLAARGSGAARRLPLLDWINPSERIRQVVLPDVLADQSPVPTPATDRCTTCHVNIDRPEFAEANVLAYLERQLASIRNTDANSVMPEFWEAWAGLVATGGPQSSAADSPGDHPGRAEARPSQTTASAAKLRALLEHSLPPDQWRLLRERYRYALIAELNTHRATLGQPPLSASSVLLAHPKLNLYAGAESPHPLESAGCTTCHDGSGLETDFVLAAHVSRGHFVDATTGAPVLLEPHDGVYTDPVTGVSGRAVRQLDYWRSVYEVKSGTTFDAVYRQWDFPMRPGQLAESNCARCHGNISDIRREAPTLAAGRNLFLRHCGNCHQADSLSPDQRLRRIGPDLRHVTDKLSRRFVETWIWAPKEFRPSTRMPHFFMLENNSSEEEIRRTRQEVRAMSAYLEFTSTSVLADIPVPVIADEPQRIARGRLLFLGLQGSGALPGKQGGLGCIGCHTNLNETGQRWIVNDLLKTGQAPSATAATARYQSMSYNERHRYALDHFPQPSLTGKPPAYSDGSPRPVFQTFGPELSNIGDKFVVPPSGGKFGVPPSGGKFGVPPSGGKFGVPPSGGKFGVPPSGGSASKASVLAGHEQQTTGDSGRPAGTLALLWLQQWLLDPQRHSPGTLMPSLRLSPDDALDLACYLLAQRRSSLSPADSWRTAEIAPDPDKTAFLVAQFLAGQYDAPTAARKAVDDAELTRLAGSVLRSCDWPADRIEARLGQLSRDQKQTLYLGNRLLNHYGCANCHAIEGFATGRDRSPSGPSHAENGGFADTAPPSTTPFAGTSSCPDLSQWGQVRVERLDFGQLHGTGQIPESRIGWLTNKLRNPRIYDRGRVQFDPGPGQAGQPYAKLRMPRFFWSEDQIEALATFVLSNRSPQVTQRLLDKAGPPESRTIAIGTQLLESNNCGACHSLGDNAPSIGQYWQSTLGLFPKEDLQQRGPPPLRGEGARVQHAWLYEFFRNVEKGGTGPLGRIRPLPSVRMPSFLLTDAQASALVAHFSALANRESAAMQRQLGQIRAPVAADAALFDAQILSDAFRNAYPFEPTFHPAVSQERFGRGESLLHLAQCQACHIVGDEKSPGVNQNPKGPNLGNIHRRIRPEWARRWIQEPQVIYPGGPMPSIFFSGQSVLDTRGVPFTPDKASREEIRKSRQEYGATADEQIRLLLDFLYSAGQRRYTSSDPAVRDQP